MEWNVVQCIIIIKGRIAHQMKFTRTRERTNERINERAFRKVNRKWQCLKPVSLVHTALQYANFTVNKGHSRCIGILMILTHVDCSSKRCARYIKQSLSRYMCVLCCWRSQIALPTESRMPNGSLTWVFELRLHFQLPLNLASDVAGKIW